MLSFAVSLNAVLFASLIRYLRKRYKEVMAFSNRLLNADGPVDDRVKDDQKTVVSAYNDLAFFVLKSAFPVVFGVYASAMLNGSVSAQGSSGVWTVVLAIVGFGLLMEMLGSPVKNIYVLAMWRRNELNNRRPPGLWKVAAWSIFMIACMFANYHISEGEQKSERPKATCVTRTVWTAPFAQPKTSYECTSQRTNN